MSIGNEAIIYSESEISKIKNACRASGIVRNKIKNFIQPGMDTKFIDDAAYDFIKSTGGKSAFLGYLGFPCNICISINDEVVHGICSKDKIINSGDVVSIDVGVCLDGYFGDTAETFIVNCKNDDKMINLINKTKMALLNGISSAIDGNCVSDISKAIQKIGDECNFGIVKNYAGHGCGRALHTFPEIPNYVINSTSPMLHSGMVLSIEPMFNMGTHEVILGNDDWTVKTADSNISAHFEHTILVHKDKPEVLTYVKE